MSLAPFLSYLFLWFKTGTVTIAVIVKKENAVYSKKKIKKNCSLMLLNLDLRVLVQHGLPPGKNFSIASQLSTNG